MENSIAAESSTLNDLYNVGSNVAVASGKSTNYGLVNADGTVSWTTYRPNIVSSDSTNDLSSTELREIIEKKIKEETDKIEDLERTTILSEEEFLVTYQTIIQYHLGNSRRKNIFDTLFQTSFSHIKGQQTFLHSGFFEW